MALITHAWLRGTIHLPGAEITINKHIHPHSYNMIHLMKIGER